MTWVLLYRDRPPIYGEHADLKRAMVADLQAVAGLRPLADAEVDEDLAAELARWSTGNALALSVAVLTARLPSLTDAEVRAALDGEARGKGRSGALDAIATEIRRRGL
jgi:hypothetical protein